MRRMFTFLAFITISTSSLTAPALNAGTVLRKADEIRNPSQSFKMLVEVESDDNTQVLEVFLKGQDKTVIVTKQPARDIGRNMLMLDRTFYAYIPNLKRSVRLSLAQKLNGQVANGDIARTRWHGDYKPEIRAVQSGEIELFLEGLRDNLTYQKMRLWVAEKTYRPLRAEYLSLDGKTLLKKAYFEEYKAMAGNVRPALIRIEDVSGNTSRIRIKNMTIRDLKDSYFTQRNLESLR